MAGNRRSNYQLSTLVAQMLRRLTANGLNRDRTLAEDLIRDLDSRLCPHASAKAATTADPTLRLADIRTEALRLCKQEGRVPAIRYMRQHRPAWGLKGSMDQLAIWQGRLPRANKLRRK